MVQEGFQNDFRLVYDLLASRLHQYSHWHRYSPHQPHRNRAQYWRLCGPLRILHDPIIKVFPWVSNKYLQIARFIEQLAEASSKIDERGNPLLEPGRNLRDYAQSSGSAASNQQDICNGCNDRFRKGFWTSNQMMNDAGELNVPLLTYFRHLPIDVIDGCNIASCRCGTEGRHEVSLKCNREECRDSLSRFRAQGSSQNSAKVLRSSFHGKDVFLRRVVRGIPRKFEDSYKFFRHVCSTLVYLFIEFFHTLPNLLVRNNGAEDATRAYQAARLCFAALPELML